MGTALGGVQLSDQEQLNDDVAAVVDGFYESLRLSLKNIFGRNGILTSWTAEPTARQYKEDLGRALFLYVGSHPSQLEPAWEDMKLCKTVAVMMRGGLFGLDEAIRCCHDCLYALLTATAARI
ncbi:hypothetical protein F0562_007044 [Nyssa sinensis]|uniref:Uncharacterized protein n=1 Tax=Nyssa sinensis TaxID=561372 RepID=A0A5J5A5J0_9ASTE|nr:hypothetical protein F0562_007044 [Nyssa sinensis]